MAKLSAHGTEVFRWDGITHRYSYRSDGHILRNGGDGWKLWKKLKDRKGMPAYVERLKEQHRKSATERPLLAHAVDLFHGMVPFKARFWVYEAICLLVGPSDSDPDGLWSTLDDHPCTRELGLSVEECVELCNAFQTAMAERLDLTTAAK